MKKYTEDDMILFALHFGMEIVSRKSRDEKMPNASIELENWKTKLEKS